MTDTNPIVDDTEQPAAVDSSEPEPTAEDTADTREAKKYRLKLRDAETQLGAVTERLNLLMRAEVERIAAAHLADGADIWRDGAELAALLDADGNIDPDKVTNVAKQQCDSHPHWRRRSVPAGPPASTVTSDGKIGDNPAETFTWGDVLKAKPSPGGIL